VSCIAAAGPPLNIQIESGRQSGSLMISWLPLTISCDMNVGSNIAGYVVYVNNVEVKRLMNPTGEQSVNFWLCSILKLAFVTRLSVWLPDCLHLPMNRKWYICWPSI